ncbi:MAG: HTH domain-containing protein [Clostridiales bacterium]|jgi:predicted DNA-binding transcriptional regulator YafY|nr:HTH domain-containing protein [Clostridiales bacterium]
MELLSRLNARRSDTAANLAFEFQVSVNTIYRDIGALSDYPIYTVQGKGGGIYMMDGCRAGRDYLSEAQAEVLTRAVELLNSDDQAIVRAILKKFAVPERKKR